MCCSEDSYSFEFLHIKPVCCVLPDVSGGKLSWVKMVHGFAVGNVYFMSCFV